MSFFVFGALCRNFFEKKFPHLQKTLKKKDKRGLKGDGIGVANVAKNKSLHLSDACGC